MTKNLTKRINRLYKTSGIKEAIAQTEEETLVSACLRLLSEPELEELMKVMNVNGGSLSWEEVLFSEILSAETMESLGEEGLTYA